MDTPHVFKNFDLSLFDIENIINKMLSIANENLKNAVDALSERDVDLCNKTISEEEIEQLDNQVDRDSFEILIRYNPVARDLRNVISGMKISNNLYQISSEAKYIAKRVKKILKQDSIVEASLISDVYEKVSYLINSSISYYFKRSNKLDPDFYSNKKELNQLHKSVIKDITKSLDASSNSPKAFVYLIFIVKSLNQIGEYALSIFEECVFLDSATNIKHLSAKEAVKEIEENSLE